MITNFTVISIPQWTIFAAITAIIYGWVEDKKAFGLLGTALFALLGIFAGYTIYAGLLMPDEWFNTAENFGGEELFDFDELPLEGRMLPLYWAMVVNGVAGFSATIAEWLNYRYARHLKVLIGTFGLVIFFGIIGIAKL